MNTRISFEEVPKGLMSSMMTVENYVNSNGFDLKLLELIRYHVSSLNECAYCIDMHFKEAVSAGEEPQRLYSVAAWRETPYYTEKERAVLEWSESITLTHMEYDRQALYLELLKHMELSDIANLTIAITQINSWNRLAKTFGFKAGTYQVENS